MTSSSVKKLVIIPKNQWDEMWKTGCLDKVTGMEKTVDIPVPHLPEKKEEEEKGEIARPPLPPPPSLHPVPERAVKGEGGGNGEGEGKGGEEREFTSPQYLERKKPKKSGVWKPPGIPQQSGRGYPKKPWISL